MTSRVIVLSILLLGAVDVSGAQATYQQGTWAAQSSNGARLGGTWTAVPDTTNGTVTGTWTLIDPQGKTVAGGAWSASKSPDEWIGNWRAVADGSNADYVGTWTASVDLKRNAGFADLFKLALKSIVSGRWRLGPYAGTWSISAQSGATTTTSSGTDSKTPEMSHLLVDFRAATHPLEEKEILGRWLLVKEVDTEEFLTGRVGPEHILADERGVRDTTSGQPYHWELTVTRDNQGQVIGASRTTWTAPETSRLDITPGEITFSKDYGGNSAYRYRCRMPAADRMICIFDTTNPGHAVEFRKFSNESQTPAATSPPTRDPHTTEFVAAKELPDGEVPPSEVDGSFIIGPTHSPAAEMIVRDSLLRGVVRAFTMNSADSKIFPGIARDSGTFGTPSPTDPATLVVTTSHPQPYTRMVQVYIPRQYVPGSVMPFIVGADGPDRSLFTAVDNLIAEKKIPPMIAISIGNGGGDAQGSERGLEYDTMSGRYAEFVETEVLPLVEKQFNVKLTKDPEGRATMGSSSGGIAAFIMAWYHPELYHRVLAYSITAVNQQWPHNAETPHGAWEFHEHIIPNGPRKPIRIWMEVGDRDLLNPNVMRDDMHDWVVASESMAKVLAAKGYHYQFVFARNAGHSDRSVKQQTLPEALEWLWRGYR